jgi:hypothetical protein
MSNVCDPTAGNKLQLKVENDETIAQFTTLLQSGIYMDAPQGCSIGEILCSLPGFTEEYISKNVQTLFLNGIPADDLSQPIFGESAIIAASAAMPGLAGAIFRKGGRHASLRSTPVNDKGLHSADLKHAVSIRIKLFNVIAKERGIDILSAGCFVKAAALLKFLQYREQVVGKIIYAESDIERLDTNQVCDFLESQTDIHLFITKTQ